MIYGYVKWKVEWWRGNSSNDKVDLSRYVKSITTHRTFKPVNNRCDIALLDVDILYNGSGQFVPNEKDKVFVYAKLVNNAGDRILIEDDIVWNGRFLDYKKDENDSSRLVKLSIVDWGYDVFNVHHTEGYMDGNYRDNEIIKRVIEVATENDDGSFRIDTTNVASLRNDGSPFPFVKYQNITKPAYEIINELSGTEWTNTDDEITNGNFVIKDPMIIDFRGSKAYWYEQPTDTALIIDDETPVVKISYNTANEGSANRLILDCGDDIDTPANNITIIIRDDLAEGDINKETTKVRHQIAGMDNDYDNEYHSLRATAIAEGWSNWKFRLKVQSLAKNYADTWFFLYGRGKSKLIITIPKVSIELGEIIYLSRSRFPAGKYRVTDVTQSIGESSWTTTLKVERTNFN